MRKLQILALLLVGSIFIACEKDEPNTGGNSTSETFWECKIDGETYRVEGDNAYASEWDPGNKIGVYGTEDPLTAGYKTVFISLDDLGKVGTYKLGFGEDSEASGTILYTEDGNTFVSRFVDGTGTLEITAAGDQFVEGTFNFTAPNADGTQNREITDGKFKVKFR